MQTKSVAAKVKATEDDATTGLGEFTALVSAFGNVDTYGDVIVKGAFAEDLARWEASGDPIPVVWSHKWDDPMAHIGYVTKAEETDEGLVVTATVDLDNATAAQVYRLLKGRRITQFSFAFDVLDGGPIKRDGQEVNEIRKAKIYEVGPCLVGVNQETELLGAKAHQLAVDAKAGRVLSQKNLGIVRAARDALNDLIDAADPDAGESADEAKAAPAAPNTSEPSGSDQTSEPSQADGATEKDEAPRGKSDIPADAAPRRALAVALINNAI